MYLFGAKTVATAVVVCTLATVAAGGAAEAVKIGVSLPLSGNLAPFGKPAVAGIRLRVDEINAAGGVKGARLELVIEDNKGDATETVNVFNKLAGTDGVAAVIGPLTSTNALAMRRAAKELKVPALSPTATNDKVTLKSGWMFRACFNDSFRAARHEQ
jgi:branched-chain amino acid transport system substrate-binding protein